MSQSTKRVEKLQARREFARSTTVGKEADDRMRKRNKTHRGSGLKGAWLKADNPNDIERLYIYAGTN